VPRPLLGPVKVALAGPSARVLAGSGALQVSTNGMDYFTNSVSGTFNAGVFATNTYLLGQSNGAVVRSTNGLDWTTHSTGGASLNGLARGGGQFIAVGNNGDIRTSPQGTAWSGRFSGTSQALLGVTHGLGQFVAVGAGGTILTSPDASSWSGQDSGTIASLRGVTWGNGVFVAVGDGGTVRVSTNAVDWHAVDLGIVADLLGCLALRGQLLISSSGAGPDGFPVLFSSRDGWNWNRHRWPVLDTGYGMGAGEKTLFLFGINGSVSESGELNPLALFNQAYHPVTGFSFRATGEPATSSRLQKSTNFVNWVDVMTYTNSAVPALLGEPASGAGAQFYRVVSP
jgi:hypothetical protein